MVVMERSGYEPFRAKYKSLVSMESDCLNLAQVMEISWREVNAVQVRVIDAILESVSETSDLLRQGESSGQVGSINPFGDHQLKVFLFPRVAKTLSIC